jgi:hypothetical protein
MTTLSDVEAVAAATRERSAPSGFTWRVLPEGARRRLAPTFTFPTRTLSADQGAAPIRR